MVTEADVRKRHRYSWNVLLQRTAISLMSFMPSFRGEPEAGGSMLPPVKVHGVMNQVIHSTHSHPESRKCAGVRNSFVVESCVSCLLSKHTRVKE